MGLGQDLAVAGVELPALTVAGRWKSAQMPTRNTLRQGGAR